MHELNTNSAIDGHGRAFARGNCFHAGFGHGDDFCGICDAVFGWCGEPNEPVSTNSIKPTELKYLAVARLLA
jgi:hypothetical protein